MSKKHFIAIAAEIKREVTFQRDSGNEQALSALEDVARGLASQFAGFNPYFDRQRFLTACGF